MKNMLLAAVVASGLFVGSLPGSPPPATGPARPAAAENAARAALALAEAGQRPPGTAAADRPVPMPQVAARRPLASALFGDYKVVSVSAARVPAKCPLPSGR